VPKIAELKLSSCGLEVADFRKNCDCRIAVAEQHLFKSCGIAIAEVLPSSGIAIADFKKSCACPPLIYIYIYIYLYIYIYIYKYIYNIKHSIDFFLTIGGFRILYN
jgi:hypothetical protein